MQKAFTLFFLIYFAVFNIQAQCTRNVSIPDINFKTVLLENSLINTDGDSEISCEEAESYNGIINITNTTTIITDLTGIEDFSNITQLNCQDNALTNLDLSNNIKLKVLLCYNNNLKNLNLSNNPALKILFCYNNNLTNLDLTNNTALSWLKTHQNNLTSLDVSNSPDLEFLQCYDNKLTNLNVANNNNPKLVLYAYKNPDLTCIQADSESTSFLWIDIDNTTGLSDDCSSSTNLCSDHINLKIALQENTPINTNEISSNNAKVFTSSIGIGAKSKADLIDTDITHFLVLYFLMLPIIRILFIFK